MGTINRLPAMTGATDSTAGTAGLVPQPQAGDEAKFLNGAGTWAEAGGGGGTDGSLQAFYTENKSDKSTISVTKDVYSDIPDMDKTITPTSTGSKFLFVFSGSISNTLGQLVIDFFVDDCPISQSFQFISSLPDILGNSVWAGTQNVHCGYIMDVYEPNSDKEFTVKVKVTSTENSDVFVNSTYADTNNINNTRMFSQLNILEIL